VLQPNTLKIQGLAPIKIQTISLVIDAMEHEVVD